MPFQTYIQGDRHSRRAVAAIFSLVILVVLLGFTALTVDIGHIYNVRAELQNAADAAALAAIQLLPNEAEALATARKYANMNHAQYGDVVGKADVLLGRWDWDLGTFAVGGTPVNAVHVYTHRSKKNGNPVDLFFAPIFGKQATEVSASATAALGRANRWDVVIVQDVTGSFVEEIDEARLADLALLDCINTNAPDTLLGLVTFTGFGKVIAPLKSVSSQYDSLKTAINKITNCGVGTMPKCSGTNIGAGLDAAIGLLTTSTSVGLPRAIILVTDGMPQSSSNNPGYTDSQLKKWAITSADKAASNGISVFTLYYSGNESSSEAEDYLRSLVRGEGTAHSTASADEIGDKLQEICKDGMNSMLVR